MVVVVVEVDVTLDYWETCGSGMPDIMLTVTERPQLSRLSVHACLYLSVCNISHFDSIMYGGLREGTTQDKKNLIPDC